MPLDPAELAKDAQAELPSDAKLRNVATLANQQYTLELEIEELNKKLTAKKLELETLATKTLPEAILDTGLRKFETNTVTVKLEHQYFPAVVKDDEPSFYQWLVDNQKDGILNVSIVIPLGKGEWARGQELEEQLRGIINAPIEVKCDIHWQTFRKFARELFEAGEEPPPELKVHQVDRAKVKLKE